MSNPPEPPRRPGRAGVFGNRSFLDYFGMYLSSRSSFQVANVGLVWVVYAVTGSALDVAVVGVSNTVATLAMTLPAGVWIDRFDRPLLLFVSNAGSTICLVLLTFFGVGERFSLPAVVAVVLVWAAASELYRSTSYAVVPDIVPSRELANANGIAQSGFQLVTSISTVLGGALIVAAGVISTFVFGVLGYGAAALFSGLLLLRTRKGAGAPHSGTKAKPNMVREIREGFGWLLTQRGLLWLSILALVFNFVFGIPTYFIVIYVTRVLDVGAFYYGAILAVFVAGGAAGSLLAGRLPRTLAYPGKAVILSWGFGGGSLLSLLGLYPSLPVALASALGIGLGIGFGNTVWLTSAQNLVPTEMRGRYFAIDGLLSFAGGPPSIAVGGVLIAAIGITAVFLLSGGLLLVFAVAFALVKSLWALDGRPRRGEAGDAQAQPPVLQPQV